jgi:death-on-curing protein
VKEPIWVEKELTLIIHDRQLAEHGGSSGIRDVSLLESALAKPKNVYAYPSDTITLPRLAASCAYGIATNHPFIDGNKRTALVVAVTFLRINGVSLSAPLEDTYLIFLGVAAGEIGEEELARWLEENCVNL